MKIVVIKYNAGNVYSVSSALQRLGYDPLITSNLNEIETADKIIFPGVGEASSAMEFLKQNSLDKVIPNLKQPFLGVCLGLQLLCKYSEVNDTECLGVFDEGVKLFPPEKKVPHMGWNLINTNESKLFIDLPDNAYVYFVHSYFVNANPAETVSGVTDYGTEFASALVQDNIFAVQFHPEKSQLVGLTLLKNFLLWDGV